MGINCAVNVLHGFAVVSALMGKFPLGAALDRRRDATGAVVVVTSSTLTDSFPRPHPAVFTGRRERDAGRAQARNMRHILTWTLRRWLRSGCGRGGVVRPSTVHSLLFLLFPLLRSHPSVILLILHIL